MPTESTSRLVALSVADENAQPFGVVELPSPFPATPSMLMHKGKVYLAQEAYGPAVPGHPEIADLYCESDDFIVLADDAVKPFVP